MRIWLARHPFLLLGLATFALFLVVEMAPGVSRAAPALLDVLGVLMVPLWLMRTLEMFVGMGTWPDLAQLAVALPLLFTPYVVADWLRARTRASRTAKFGAAAI